MKMKFFLMFATSMVLGAALALPAAPGKSEPVSYKSGDETVTAFLALPESAGRHPAVIVIHEWWGLNDWVKDQAQKFAAQGYVALAVDLYRGHSAADAGEAHELMRGLPQDRGIRDLKSAFDYLAARSDVDAKKIGSVGWCMGGGYSINLAVAEPRLMACVVNYGALPTDAEAIRKIHARVLGSFGAEDRGITPDSVRAFEANMKASGKPADLKIYEGAGHAFENSNNKDGYRPDAAKDAWERTLAFLMTALR